MNQITAEQIARKVRAFKHADKLCKEIEKKGKVTIILNNTGLTFVVQNGDPMHFKIAATRATLAEEIASYEFIKTRETTDYANANGAVSKKKVVLSKRKGTPLPSPSV